MARNHQPVAITFWRMTPGFSSRGPPRHGVLRPAPRRPGSRRLPAVVRTFIVQLAAGEAGCQKLIEGGIRLWSQIPPEALRSPTCFIACLTSTGDLFTGDVAHEREARPQAGAPLNSAARGRKGRVRAQIKPSTSAVRGGALRPPLPLLRPRRPDLLHQPRALRRWHPGPSGTAALASSGVTAPPT
jgi:hypothetical protein